MCELKLVRICTTIITSNKRIVGNFDDLAKAKLIKMDCILNLI